MQQIIDLKAKLESGESKKYSELRDAIADFHTERGITFEFNFDIRTKEGKGELLAEAAQLIAEEQETIEDELADSIQPMHPVKEVVEPLKDVLMERLNGAKDESRMQDVIDRAGLWDELEKAWHSIPNYKDFEPIFSGDAAMGMFAEMMMSKTEHANYVRVCESAQRIQEDFTRKALELISQ